MKAVMTIEHGATPTEWLVTWALPTDAAGQHINVRMAVPFAHPSPRVSDLERAARNVDACARARLHRVDTGAARQALAGGATHVAPPGWRLVDSPSRWTCGAWTGCGARLGWPERRLA